MCTCITLTKDDQGGYSNINTHEMIVPLKKPDFWYHALMTFFPKKLICETSTVAYGDMSFNNNRAPVVIHNRGRFVTSCGISLNSYVPTLCNHTDVIATVTRSHAICETKEPQGGVVGDAIVTQEKGIALFLLTADCLPICIFDPITETIALAHVSRVTFGKQLPQKTIRYMEDTFDVTPETVHVFIAPHIHKKSYSFPLPLIETDSLLLPYMEEKEGRVHIDLTFACVQALTSTGVLRDNIAISPLDTADSEEYYSYFKMKQTEGPTTARIATVLMMK